jgi:hypothetical protein
MDICIGISFLFLLPVISVIAILVLTAADKENCMSKYFTYKERLEFESCLKERQSFGTIAMKLGKDRRISDAEPNSKNYIILLFFYWLE